MIKKGENDTRLISNQGIFLEMCINNDKTVITDLVKSASKSMIADVVLSGKQ